MRQCGHPSGHGTMTGAVHLGGWVDASLHVDRNELTTDVNHNVDLLVSSAGPEMRQVPARGVDFRSQLCDYERFDVAASKRWIAG